MPSATLVPDVSGLALTISRRLDGDEQDRRILYAGAG